MKRTPPFEALLGASLAALFILQAISGATLALYYTPLPATAFESVSSLSGGDPVVAYLSRIHDVNTGFLVVLILVHLCFTAFHLRPVRLFRINWLVGVLLWLLTLKMAFTGSVLVWSQDAFQGLQILAGVSESLPIAGPLIVRFLLGGDGIGAMTLPRFLAFHTLWQPAAFLVLFGIHLYLCRERTRKLFRGARTFLWVGGSVFFVLLAVFLFAGLSLPPLEIPASPTGLSYEPRPAWYFLPFFELSRLSQPVLTVAIVTVFFLVIAGLPWLSTGSEAGRPGWVVTVLIVGFLLVAAWSRIWHPGTLDRAAGLQVNQLPLPESRFVTARQSFFDQKCVNCHALGGVGGILGPDLLTSRDEFDRDYFARHIAEPGSHEPASQMPAYADRLTSEEIEGIVDYLFSVNSQ